jgi:Fur family transcriptional regulator, peroxide stress response regulator
MKDKKELFTQSLSNAGLRLTPQRLAICALLADSDNHPTAHMIYEELHPQFPSLSLSTVYNTLDTLVKLGVVNALGSAGDGVEHYDSDIQPHVNLACLSCNKVIDLHSQHVNELEQEVVDASGFKIKGARVMYYGYCPLCQSKENDL